MSGRAPTGNPIRRIARIAARQAMQDMRGTSGAGATRGFSSSAPASVTRVDDDGNEQWTALTELDMTNDPQALTAI